MTAASKGIARRVVVHLVDGKPVPYWLDPETGILRPLTEAELAAREASMAELDEAFGSTAPEPEDAASDGTEEDVSIAAPAPSKPPPPMKGRAKKQGREWIWLPAPAVVYQTYPTVREKTLKTGKWYQMKVNDDGSRDFYNKKGNWIGTSPVDDRGKVRVQVRDQEVGE